MLKHDLIRLVRAAQREQDPKRRAELWELVRQAGLPVDATVEDSQEQKDAPGNQG